MFTTTPRLEEEFRFDIARQSVSGGHPTDNYGLSKALELAPARSHALVEDQLPDHQAMDLSHKKIKAVQTAGGHYRIPESYRARGRNSDDRRTGYRNVSERNQLVGSIVDIRTSGLIAQVTLDVGGQLITSIITSGAVHEMGLKKGQIAAALIKATEVMILRV